MSLAFRPLSFSSLLQFMQWRPPSSPLSISLRQAQPAILVTSPLREQVASAQSNSGVNSCFRCFAQAGLPKSVSLVAGDTPLVNVKDPSAADTTAPLGQATGTHSPQPTSMCKLGHGISQLKPVPMVTPINADKLQAELHSYPNQARASYVLSDIRSGFRLGFDASRLTLKSASTNMHSSTLHPAVIDDYLHTELQKGRVAGPFSTPPWPNLHISWFGVIPKKNQPGKWHLILDLSSPAGSSMNDGIPKESFSVQYMKVDDIISGVMSRGRGTLMAKFDVESAYRNVAVHPEDRQLLGMKWQDKYFVDMVLPFGLRSAPFIFSSIGDLVEWILRHNYGIDFLQHYLDDFHTLGPPNSPVCQRNLDTCIRSFADWGIPLHPDKFEGPSTCLTVLGIELDSIKLQARLPQDKFQRISSLLEVWSQKRYCKRKELESLIGNLQHACKVAPQGRTFLRRMINLLVTFRRDDHPIRLNREFHLDLTWWREFFKSWDGLSFLLSPRWAPLPDFQVTSDAAGAIGYGAIFSGHWFAGKWLTGQQPLSIAYKELFPAVIAAALWGSKWVSKRVKFRSDNKAVIAVLQSGTSRDPNMMVLLRYLSLLAARHSFAFTASSIKGRLNPIADALSRFQFQRFRGLAPHANQEATEISLHLLEDLPVV